MTELNGGPIPIDRKFQTAKGGLVSGASGVLLASRQLTITLDPRHHTLLTDLVKVSNMSVHDTASDLLRQAIGMAHMDLVRQKLVWLLCWWIVWGS